MATQSIKTQVFSLLSAKFGHEINTVKAIRNVCNDWEFLNTDGSKSSVKELDFRQEYTWILLLEQLNKDTTGEPETKPPKKETIKPIVETIDLDSINPLIKESISILESYGYDVRNDKPYGKSIKPENYPFVFYNRKSIPVHSIHVHKNRIQFRDPHTGQIRGSFSTPSGIHRYLQSVFYASPLKAVATAPASPSLVLQDDTDGNQDDQSGDWGKDHDLNAPNFDYFNECNSEQDLSRQFAELASKRFPLLSLWAKAKIANPNKPVLTLNRGDTIALALASDAKKMVLNNPKDYQSTIEVVKSLATKEVFNLLVVRVPLNQIPPDAVLLRI